MATSEKIVSPGVFTNEKDLSFLPAGIAAIGAAIIGPTPQGPAFVPTIVENFDDFTARFGGLSEETYVPYAVESYLKAASTVTVIRVLPDGGYKAGSVFLYHTVAELSASTFYEVKTPINNDTGSSFANVGPLAGPLSTKFVKIQVATESVDLVDTSLLQNLVFYSGSTPVALTPTGSIFVSGGFYAMLITGSAVPPYVNGDSYTNVFKKYAPSATATNLVGVINPTVTLLSSTGKDYTTSVFPSMALPNTGSSGLINFTLSGSGITAAGYTASVNPTVASSFDKVLSTSVKGTKKGYMYTWFKDYLGSATGLSGVITFDSSSNANVNLSGSADGTWRPAYTPWIQTQTIGGAFQDLFRFATLSDGTDTNTTLKVSIVNTVLPGVNPGSPYGSFTVVIREYDDTDKRQTILETYSNVNLDPDSVDYIARRIGDRSFNVSTAGVVTLTGDYNNVSKYVRVEVSDEVGTKTMTTAARPYGFKAPVETVASSYTLPTASYITSAPQIDGFYNKRANYGWNFASNDNAQYNKPLPSGSTVGNNVAFNLDNCFVHPSASAGNSNSVFVGGQSISGSTFAGLDVANILKFTVAFQDGFDGMDPAIPKKVGEDIESTNVFGLNCANSSTDGTIAYTKALNTISNGDEYDVNLIAIPGINANNHLPVAIKAIEVAEDRGDAFAIIDPVKLGRSLNETISAVQLSNIESNYVAMYWPWVKVIDRDRNKPVWVPPSVVLPRVYANNDTVAYEWFAPAGLNRGGIRDAVDVETKLSQADRNDLYENRINPIASFPAQGICVWGQKTMQATPSALDRVNVRRLLIALKKYIASSARYLVFENNTAVTRQRFINIVTPYLETVKSRQGLYAFKVVMDETNNTPDIIDRNILYGQIYLQPAKAAEFIVLDFNVLRTGATFENA
jgi:hypothetical protein